MKQIGRYRIISELGRGAMGVVFRAHDPQIDREIALKTIRLASHADTSEIKDMRDRLIREARSAGRLSHPGIVTIFDAGEQDGLAYVAMELVEGRSLASILTGPVVPDRKLEFLVALLEKAGSALDYASAKGVVHRDVKPANIMVSGRTVKLLDFGVARIASSQTTRAGAVFGTPNYMSPEQVQGQHVDGRSDQFSLAVIAYEILCGAKPFEAPAIPATLYKIVHDDPRPLRAYLPDIPVALEQVVLRALRKSPQGRFESCEEFAKAFSVAANGLAGLEPPLSAARDSSRADVDLTLDSHVQPLAGHGELTGLDTGSQGPGGQAAPPQAGDLPPQPLLPLPPRAGQGTPGRGAGEPLLPVGEMVPARVGPVAEPRSRWPNLIFALLVLAICALALLLVRYPGLIEDPAALMDAILGTTPAGSRSASPRDAVPLPPAAERPGQSGRKTGENPDPSADTLRDEPPVGQDSNARPGAGPDRSDNAAEVATGEPEAVKPPAPTLPDVPSDAVAASQGGVVFFQSPVEGVVVTLDGNRAWQCITPCRLAGLPFGERNLVARRDGYAELRRTLTISQDATTVNLPMERVGSVLLVSSEPPEARILLDGRDTGHSTNARLTVAPGQHVIRLVLGRLSAERTIDVAASETRYLRFRLGTE